MCQPAAETAPSAKTILVVEDEILIRLLVCDYLRTAGFTVAEAGNADEAMALLNSPDNDVALIFSDVRMPGSMDGVELMSHVTANQPCIKLVLTSAHLTRSDLPADIAPSVQLIPKPYMLADIATLIHDHLKNDNPNSDCSNRE